MTDQRLLDALTRAAEAYADLAHGPHEEWHPWDGHPGNWHASMVASGYRVFVPDFTSRYWLAYTIQDSVRAGRAGGGAFDPEAALAEWQRSVDDVTLHRGQENLAFLHKDDPEPEHVALEPFSNDALLREVRRRGLHLDHDPGEDPQWSKGP